MDIEATLTDEMVFRPTRDWLELGLTSAVLFALVGIVSAICAFLNVDGSFAYPVLAAVVFGSFFSFPALLGCWMVATYYRHRLVVSREFVRLNGCRGARQVQLADVTRATWNATTNGGTLQLHDADGKLKIRFGNYTYSERSALIEHFRVALAHIRQEDWDRF